MNSHSLQVFLVSAHEWFVWIGLVLCLVAETWWPVQQHPNRWRHIFRNVQLAVIGGLVSLILLGLGVVPAINYAQANGWGLLNVFSLPFWLKCVIGVLALDFFDYIFHRMSHQVRWLWLLHSVHHSDLHMDVSTSVRTHPVHGVLIVLWKSTAALALGAPLLAFFLREFGALLFSHIHHANIRWSHYPNWLAKLFMLPQAHWLHHCREPRLTNRNYGPFLSIWDHAFDTYLRPMDTNLSTQGELGLQALAHDSWQTLRGLLRTPWRARHYPSL